MNKNVEIERRFLVNGKCPIEGKECIEIMQGYICGEMFHKKLILTHHKELNMGDFLVDDKNRNGAAEFKGKLIPFGSDKFPDWKSVVEYLLQFD